jgi:hypothetical protein
MDLGYVLFVLKRKINKFFDSTPTPNNQIQLSKDLKFEYIDFFPFAGYILLIITLKDYVSLIYPPQFFKNSYWELDVIGRLSDTVWAPAIALGLIFFTREGTIISRFEKRILGFISWLVLLLAIAYILATPLVIGDCYRIYLEKNKEVSVEISKQIEQIDKFEKDLNKTPDSRLKQLLTNRNQRPNLRKLKSTEELKKELVYKATAEQKAIANNLKKELKKLKSRLTKQAIKISIGTILGGLLFIKIWQYSKWTR